MNAAGQETGQEVGQEVGLEPLWRHFAMAGLIAALLIPFLFFQPFGLIEARLSGALCGYNQPTPKRLPCTVSGIYSC